MVLTVFYQRLITVPKNVNFCHNKNYNFLTYWSNAEAGTVIFCQGPAIEPENESL